MYSLNSRGLFQSTGSTYVGVFNRFDSPSDEAIGIDAVRCKDRSDSWAL